MIILTLRNIFFGIHVFFYGFAVSSIFSDKKLNLNINVINTLYYDYLKKMYT